MNLQEKYDKVITDNLGIALETIISKDFTRENRSDIWSSFVHYVLVVELEDEFDIRFSREDILKFVTYESGLEIVKKLIDSKSGGDIR